MAARKPKQIPKSLSWNVFFQIREQVVGHRPDPLIIIRTMSRWDTAGGWGGNCPGRHEQTLSSAFQSKWWRFPDKKNKNKRIFSTYKGWTESSLETGWEDDLILAIRAWFLTHFLTPVSFSMRDPVVFANITVVDWIIYNRHSTWRSKGAALIHSHNMTYRNLSCSQSRGSVFHTVECELRRKEPNCGAMINFVSV